MSFLLGAFGKLAAGQRYRSLQARMMRVQSKVRRVSREVEKVNKQIETSKKMELNALNYQEQAMSSGLTAYSGAGDASSAEYAQWAAKNTQDKAAIQMQITQAKAAIEEKYEKMNNNILEPLKDEEDSLQTEKDSLETQVQVAKSDYEACQKMEQSDAKMLAPNYTGGQ